jgi:hypothetical protein
MKKSKLITILIELEKEEWASLRRHILQYTNVESDSFEIFDFFSERRRKLEALDDTDEVVTKHFPKLTTKVFLNHMSTIYQWVEEWLVIQQIKKEKYEYELKLHKALNNRGHYNLANQVADKLMKEIDSCSKIDIEESRAKWNLLENQHYSNNPIIYQNDPSVLSDMLESFLLHQKAKLLIYKTEMINFGRMTNFDYCEDMKLCDKIADLIPKDTTSYLLDTLSNLFENPNMQDLQKVLNIILKNEIEDRSLLQELCVKYTIRSFSKLHQSGKLSEDQRASLFGLFNLGLQKGTHSEKGKVAAVSFRNIVIQIANLNDYEQCNSFILEWINKVSSKEIESTKNVCQALNCFYHERYEEILNHTWMKSYDDIIEKTLALFLQLTYFFYNRISETELYITMLKNFQGTLARNKKSFSESLFLGYSNLYDFMKNFDHTTNKVEKLKSYKTIQFRLWCERMIKEDERSKNKKK